MATKKSRPTAAEVLAGECLAVRVRILNRAVSALYDEALRPHGLRVGQLNLLAAVGKLGTARPGDLCRVLRMDKSTLSRDAEVLRRNGWLEIDDAADARSRPLKLTADGHALLESALPAWRKAQEAAVALIGAEGKAALGRVVDRLWKDGAVGR
ncbi:MAG TPA: MarR family winged helix-turn-helix transcriptional regulator [Isosphaeraceae bacterium]|jgi:DNA-binding MarR family transcriptional regulator|nr:MarR family winged helix-turn-helix transcriptional regulator [Isosphaeraceae bacterium]